MLQVTFGATKPENPPLSAWRLPSLLGYTRESSSYHNDKHHPLSDHSSWKPNLQYSNSFRFHVRNQPLYLWKILPEVWVEDLVDRGLRRMIPSSPSIPFGVTKSFWQYSSSVDRIHHQVVISWQPCPSVQDIWPQVWWHDYKVNYQPLA